jgi:hypothetical protein
MASIIRIKRSGVTGSPSTLAQGELAYSYLDYDPITGQGGDRLYIGTGTETNGEAANIEVIGGKYFTEKLDHTPGVLTANSAIIVDSNSKIDVLNIDNITIDGNTISSTNTNGNIVLDPAGTGVIDVSATRITNLANPTANTDAVTKGYLDSELEAIGASANFNFIGDTGSDSLFLATETLAFIGGTAITTAVANNSVTISLDDTTVVANTYGSSTEIPVFTVDAQGRLTAANTVSISTDLSLTGDTGSDSISLGTDTLNVAGGTGIETIVSNNNIEIILSDTGVVANTYGSATEIPILTINEQGQITLANTATVSTDLSIGGDTGSDTISLITDTLTFEGGTGIETAVANNTVVFTLSDTAVTAGTFGSSTEIPVFTVDAQGRLTAANTVSVATDLNIAGDTGTDSVSLLTDTLTFTGGTGVDTLVSNNEITISIGQDVSTTANVVFNDGTFNGSVSANVELSTGNIVISGNTISTLAANTELVFQAGTFISANDTLIKDVADPETPGDAANKRYVDEVAQGLKVRQAAWVITVTNLSATYDPDGYETGWATLTATSVGAFPAVDDVTSETLNVVGARILVTGQTNAAHNGLYVLETPGDGSTAWVLRRCSLCRTSEQIPGSFVFVQQGTIYADTGWVATVADVTTFTIGEDAIIWTQFSGAGSFTAGNGLTLTGTEFSVNVDNSSIEIVADTLRVKEGGITNAMLAGSIANDKLTNSTITVAADSGTADAVSLGETLTFVGGTGLSTVVANNQITINGDDATTTTKGIASFSTTDFIVSSGAVSLNPESIQDTVAGLVIGGQSITVTYNDSANTLTFDADLATTSTIGVASFSSTNFNVTTGVVTIAAIDGGTY